MTKKTFKELYSSVSNEKDLEEFRLISRQQRIKMARRMKKLAKSAAFKMKVKRSKLRVADPAKLQVKARKAAKKKVVDRFYPNYKDFSIARRAQTDQMIQQKYGGLIAKLSKKLVIPLKKKEKGLSNGSFVFTIASAKTLLF